MSPEVPSNPNYSIIYTQHITKASKRRKKKPFIFLSIRTQAQQLFPWEAFQIALEFNKPKHKCMPDSNKHLSAFFQVKDGR